MTDIIDTANERAEKDLALALKAATHQSGPAAVGYCLNCGPDVPLTDGRRWCDGDCRDDWQKAQRT